MRTIQTMLTLSLELSSLKTATTFVDGKQKHVRFLRLLLRMSRHGPT
jgi:hypothetical protein